MHSDTTAFAELKYYSLSQKMAAIWRTSKPQSPVYTALNSIQLWARLQIKKYIEMQSMAQDLMDM